jgi:hypothetical protein
MLRLLNKAKQADNLPNHRLIDPALTKNFSGINEFLPLVTFRLRASLIIGVMI